MSEPLVTILTVVYNNEATIARTIESVLRQSYPSIEYIIVDGASTDRSVAVAKQYEAAFAAQEGRSLTIVSEPDRGMYDALNKGAALAHGELVGQINSDDWYEPDAVEHMVRLYEQEHYAAAWGDLYVVKASGKIIKKARIGKLWTTTGWCHPSMFSRREVLLRYPYALETIYDDFDYITRVHLAGEKICTTPKVIANFTFGDGGMSTDNRLSSAIKRAKITYSIYKKHGMSKFYWWHRLGFELVKYLFGKIRS